MSTEHIDSAFGDAMAKAKGGPGSKAASLVEAENGSAYTTLWFDPGETTGWAVFCIHPEAMEPDESFEGGEGYRIMDNIIFWSAGQFSGPENKVIDQMVDLAEAWPDDAVLGCEDFILRAQRKDRTLLSPVRITKAFEYEVCWRGPARWGRPRRELKLQQPAMAMGAVTDDRLKLWGFYNRLVGQQHARDAVRHAILWLRMEKNRRAEAYRVLQRQTERAGKAGLATAGGEQ